MIAQTPGNDFVGSSQAPFLATKTFCSIRMELVHMLNRIAAVMLAISCILLLPSVASASTAVTTDISRD
jgi:hypothetical protein